VKVRYRQTSYAVSLLIGDLFMILTALRASFQLRFESGLFPVPLGVPDFQAYAQAFGLVVLLMLFIFRAYGLYVEEKIGNFAEECLLVAKAVSASMLLLLGVTFFYRDFSFSRSYLAAAWVLILVFVCVARLGAGLLYMGYRRMHGKFKEVLMVGANRVSARYALRHLREPRLCTRVVGALDPRFPGLRSYRRLPVFGRPDDLQSVLEAHPHLNEVIVTLPELAHEEVFRIMLLCEKHLVSFKWLPDVLGLVATQMRVRYEFGLPLLGMKESPLSDWENRLLKRAMDVALSGAALAALLPVFVLVGLAVAFDSRGPVFYRQERVGEDGRVFGLYKFRTMRAGAEQETGPVWARPDDARCTRMGRLLRRLNLDELPQLWNVLKGDMSLVGPRPERPHFVGRFREDVPRYMGRHWIKSGITGWAQVNGLRGDTSIEERTKYDLFYIENWSLLLDLKILFMTLFAFKNAY
jgi:exopolysaccharide biosynthesis polyprenyl glycosylphosphotransferase